MARRKIRNYDFLSGHSWFTPGIAELFILAAMFLVGIALGSIVMVVCQMAFGIEWATEYGMVITYPLMFIPAMIYSRYKSSRNLLFETGYSVDNDHFAPVGGLGCALLAAVMTLAAGIVADPIMLLLPDMPESLQELLGGLTGGKFLLNLLCVSIMAPIFEEWLCRGMILRGLLNYKHKDKEGNAVNGIKPVWAIVISALVFAIIHGNPWQAVPAFILGCIFGYVYYRTGSLKLTMLMHCVNNTFALIMGHIPALADIESWLDVMDPVVYAVMVLIAAVVLYECIKKFASISVQSPQGNCDPLEA